MIWLIGNKGMLGSELSIELASRKIPYVGTDKDVDITNLKDLHSFAYGKQITLIINCAAYTAVDKAEDEPELCKLLNTQAAANIGKVATEFHARVIHISTDYVFDGSSRVPYKTDDTTCPTGIYGLSKSDGEKALLRECSNAIIIRTAWLYGKHGKNFVFTMLRFMNERNSIKVVNDQHGTPTWTHDLCLAIIKMSEILSENLNLEPGIYHFTNTGKTTWYDFAKEIYSVASSLGILTTKCDIHPCMTHEFPTKAKRPAYSVLDMTKTHNNLGINIPKWQDSLKDFLLSVQSDLPEILSKFK